MNMAENKKNAVDELDEELKEEQLSEDTEKDEDKSQNEVSVHISFSLIFSAKCEDQLTGKCSSFGIDPSEIIIKIARAVCFGEDRPGIKLDGP